MMNSRMNGRARNKKVDAPRKVKRIGANRQKTLEEQRALRPRVIKSIVRKASLAFATLALAAATAYAGVAYGPAAWGKVSNHIASGKALPENIRITNCSAHTEKLLRGALDSLLNTDAQTLDRALIRNAANAVSNIERVTIRKIKNRATNELFTRVRVVEREPVAIIHGGGLALVDNKGVMFAPTPGRFYDLPMLIVNETEPRGAACMEVFNRIKEVSQNLGADFFSQISQIGVHDSSHVYLYFKSGEAEYLIGHDDLEERLGHVKKIRERLLSEHGESARVDLRYRGVAFASPKRFL